MESDKQFFGDIPWQLLVKALSADAADLANFLSEPKNRSSNMGWKRRLVAFGFQINDHFQLWVWQPQIRYHFTQ